MTETTKLYDCPKVVAEALYKIQFQVIKLVNDASNDFQSYKYVSIDSYYEAIRPLLNDAELMLVPNEIESQISADGKTVKFVYEFIVLHRSGAIWNVPIRRTVYIQYGGAQSCGAALSYAEKFIMRTVFKIPTGEYDPATDENPKEVEATATITHDADSAPKPKHGSEPVVDFKYSGAPYRIFTPKGVMIKSFTDLRSWSIALKAEIAKAKTLSKEENTLSEVQRVKDEVEKDKSMTPQAKKKVTDFFDEILGDEND